MIYNQGDKVFYKRVNSKEWKGPAEVIGKDDHQVFVKHGGIFVRINPYSLPLVNARLSLDKKPKDVRAVGSVNQNLNRSVHEDVADSDSGLKENMNNEVLISSGNSKNNGILQQVQNDQSFDDTLAD